VSENPPAQPNTPRAYPVFPAPMAAPDVRERSSRLGSLALVIAVLAVAGASILSAVTAFPAAVGAMTDALALSPEGLENLANAQLLGVLSPVRGLVLWAEIGFWAGTALGIWALVQGIVAIASRRGRGPGIAAVLLAALGPVLFAVIVGVAVITGIGTGAA